MTPIGGGEGVQKNEISNILKTSAILSFTMLFFTADCILLIVFIVRNLEFVKSLVGRVGWIAW